MVYSNHGSFEHVRFSGFRRWALALVLVAFPWFVWRCLGLEWQMGRPLGPEDMFLQGKLGTLMEEWAVLLGD